MRVLVHLHYDSVKYHLLASEKTTLRELLAQTDIPEDTVLFTAPPFDANMTPLVNLDKTLLDYNMWFLEKSYIAELSAYNKTDNYKKELYEMYLEAAKETV
jgi:hypothetical protein